MKPSINIAKIRTRRNGINELRERLELLLPYYKKCDFEVRSTLSIQNFTCYNKFNIEIHYDNHYNQNPQYIKHITFEFYRKKSSEFITVCEIEQNKYNKEVYTVSDFTHGGKNTYTTEHNFEIVRKKRAKQTLEYRQWSQYEILIFREFDEVVGMCVMENNKVKCYITSDPDTGKSRIHSSTKVVNGIILPPPVLTISTLFVSLVTLGFGYANPLYVVIPLMITIISIFVCMTNDFFNPNRSPWLNAVQALTYVITGFAFTFI